MNIAKTFVTSLVVDMRTTEIYNFGEEKRTQFINCSAVSTLSLSTMSGSVLCGTNSCSRSLSELAATAIAMPAFPPLLPRSVT